MEKMFTLKPGRLPQADVKNIIFFVRPRLELMDIITDNVLRYSGRARAWGSPHRRGRAGPGAATPGLSPVGWKEAAARLLSGLGLGWEALQGVLLWLVRQGSFPVGKPHVPLD